MVTGDEPDPFEEHVQRYRSAVKDARLFDKYEQGTGLRAEEVSERYQERFLKDFEWALRHVAYAYRGSSFSRIEFRSHQARLRYALQKARFESLTDRIIDEERDVSEAVVMGYRFLGTNQPLRQWDGSLVEDEEAARFVIDHWERLKNPMGRKRFYGLVKERFGMRMSLSTARKYHRMADELQDEEDYRSSA